MYVREQAIRAANFTLSECLGEDGSCVEDMSLQALIDTEDEQQLVSEGKHSGKVLRTAICLAYIIYNMQSPLWVHIEQKSTAFILHTTGCSKAELKALLHQVFPYLQKLPPRYQPEGPQKRQCCAIT